MPPRPAVRTRRKAVAANAADEPLPKLRQLGSRVLQDGNNAVFTQHELFAAEDELVQWVKKKEEDAGIAGSKPGVWAAVCLEGLPALYGLYALALRRSCVALEPGVSDTMRTAFASLRSKLGLELVGLFEDVGATRVSLDLLGKVGFATLRSQTLRCHAALLAEAAARLAPPAGLQEPQSSLPQQPPRRGRRVTQAASDALAEARQVLDMLRAIMSMCLGKKDSHGLAFDVWDMIEEFASELTASGLLEHWSRLLLLLAGCEDWEDKAAEHLHALGSTLVDMERYLTFISKHWRRSLLLAGPCLSYLLSSHVVGLCAALDGGPTYGMPAAGAASEEAAATGGEATSAMVAPVFGATGLRLRRRGSAEGAGTALTLWALTAWGDAIKKNREDMQIVIEAAIAAAGQEGQPQSQPGPAGLPATTSLKALLRRARDTVLQAGLDPAITLSHLLDTPTAVPPLHTAAVFELCMRLVAAATGAQGAAATRGLGAAPRVAAAEAPRLARSALTCGREALGADVRTAAALGPATAARLRRWWAALVAVMDIEERQHAVEDSEWRHLLVAYDLKDPPAVVSLSGIPDRPSPCVAAALDAGYLPRFARALRRIPTATKHWEITRGELPDGAHVAWEQVLAFAPPRETAALLRAVAALVQRAANTVPAGEATARGPVKKSDINDPDAHNLRMALCTASHVYQHALLGLASPPGAVAEAAILTESANSVLAAMAGGDGAPQHAAAGQPRAEGGEGNGRCVDAPAPATLPRLGLALSCAASQLLPHVSQTLLCRHLAFAAGCEFSSCHFVKPILAQMLAWAVLVAAALKRARDQEAAAAAAAAAAATDAPVAAATAAGPSSPEVGSAAAEWRELLMTSLRLPALLGTVLGVTKAGLQRGSTEALAASFRWALSALLHLAPLETATAWWSEEAKAAEAAAEPVAAHYQQVPVSGVAGPGCSRHTEVGERAVGAADDLLAQDADAGAQLTQDEMVERVTRSVGSVPGLEVLLERAAFLVPPSQLEAVLG